MVDYSRIDTMVRAAVFSKARKIAICPFAEAGMMAKQILNQRYGISEAYLIDNRLAEINPDIVSIQALREQDTDGLIVLLMIANREINIQLTNELIEIDSKILIQNYLSPAWMLTPEKKDYFSKLKELLTVEKYIGEKGFIRVGQPYDGGYVLLDDFLGDMKVYSFGIADDISFEKELADRGLDIFLHDHTIVGLPEQHEKFHFKKCGISHIDEIDNSKLSLKTLLDSNGDLGNKKLILKMDVEGAEWDFITNVSSEMLNQFRQITFELHRITDLGNREKILSALQKINNTHQVVWIHANNYGHIEKASESLEIPAYMEVTYLNRAEYSTKKAECVFPLSIDMPDNAFIEDYKLGNWGKEVNGADK